MSWFDRLFRRKRLRRQAVLQQPIPDAWLNTIQNCSPAYAVLDQQSQRKLGELVQIFVAEKQFIGFGPLTITEEIKVGIAAQACLLLLGTPHFDVFPRLREVIVHPHDFGEIFEAIAPDGRPYQIENLHAGQAWRRGPVILAWDDVHHSIAHPCDGYNVVYHEFAHVLDMQFSITQGSPPLEHGRQCVTWQRIFENEFQAFQEAARRGRKTFLDPYGAEGHEEFFAVITEHFFEQPRQMQMRHAQLYSQLALLYRQDPARWWKDGPWSGRSRHWG